MANWNNSPFLQALGWATLNSIWQMALLWCCFLLIHHFVKLSSSKKYELSVFAVVLGFCWFVYNFFNFYQQKSVDGFYFDLPIFQSTGVLPKILSAASVAYLCLLLFPAYRMVSNWRFIQRIKKHGLQKAHFRNRLFVQKIAQQLGIRKNVKIYLSSLVASPVTIGFLKPVILLPIAAISNLSTQQVEAVLLHELSHIRRHDYLVNLLLTTIHVFLYFNPFIKLFLKKIELERENCCDEMVLQFEYDKVSYASALLELEKRSQNLHLAMAAANKNHLLHRIEKIVGMKTRRTFKTSHFAGAFAGLLMLLVVNAILIAGKEKLPSNFSIANFSQPASFFVNDEGTNGGEWKESLNLPVPAQNTIAQVNKKQVQSITAMEMFPTMDVSIEQPAHLQPGFMHVALNEADAALSGEQKEQVSKTVESTKKVLENQWNDVEREIGDAMTPQEKRLAKKDYLREIEQINWDKIEQNLKASYEEIDWNKINVTVAEAMNLAKLDSMETCYTQALTEIKKLNSCKSTVIAVPDVSVQQLQKTKSEIKQNIAEINKIRTKKIVRL